MKILLKGKEKGSPLSLSVDDNHCVDEVIEKALQKAGLSLSVRGFVIAYVGHTQVEHDKLVADLLSDNTIHNPLLLKSSQQHGE